MKSENRINWIDALRGFAMFFVIWGHTFPGKNWRVRKYIYSFHMPLFFLISGLTAKKDLELNFPTFIKKKIKSLLFPYFFINLISFFLRYILYLGNFTSFEPVHKFLIGILYSNDNVFPMPCGVTWFITALFLVEVLFYILNKISKDDSQLFIFVMIMGIIGYVNNLSSFQIHSFWHFETMFTGVVFYFAGYMIIKYIKKIENFFNTKSKMLMLGALLGIVGLIIAMANRRISMYANVYGSIILFYTSSFATISALILFVKLFLKNSKFFKNIGMMSLFYLAYHNIIIIILNHYFKVFFHKTTLHLLLMSIIVCLILFPLAKITYKYFPILVGKISNNTYDKLIKRDKYAKISVSSKEKK